MSRATFPAAALAFALVAPMAAIGQPAETETESLAEKGRALLDRTAEMRAEYRKLDARMRSEGGDARQVAALQAHKTLLAFMRAVKDLVGNVQQQQRAGLDAAATLQEARALLWSVDRRIPEFIDELQRDISRLRASQEGASAEASAATGSRIAELEQILDETVRFSAVHLANMAALGLRTDNARRAIGERLETRADDLSGRLELARKRLDEARADREGESTDTDPGTRVAQEDLDRIASSLWTTCDVMDAFGIETTKFRQELITQTGEITPDVLNLDVLRGLASQGRDAARVWFQVRGPAVLGRIGAFTAILVAFWLAGRLARRIASRLLASAGGHMSQLAQRMIVGTASRIVVGIGLFVALSQVGVNVTALLAGLGIAGFIVGFALQDTLGNFASGAMILIYQPFDVGDTIEAAGVLGSVSHMSMVSTTILTFDNQTLIVPNSKIWGDVIRNVTSQTVRRVDLEFPLSHDADVAKVEELMGAMCREHPTVLPDPPAAVRVHKITESAVLFIVRPWVKTADYWSTYWDLNREAKIRLADAGIAMGAARHEVRIEASGR